MSFDPLAPHYRWMERWFAGGKLQRCRIAFLDAIPPPSQVLIYGEGNGRFLLEFLRRFPAAQVTVVDASTAMIEQARARLSRAQVEDSRVRFIHADALAWTPPAGGFDLIVTCFFFDCFDASQLQRLVPTIAAAAAPQAHWLVADFQVASHGWRRLRSRIIVALLYAFFRRVTRVAGHELVNVGPWLQAAGFQRAQHVEHDHGLLYASWWSR